MVRQAHSRSIWSATRMPWGPVDSSATHQNGRERIAHAACFDRAPRGIRRLRTIALHQICPRHRVLASPTLAVARAVFDSWPKLRDNNMKSAPYVGDIMHKCMLRPFDFKHAFAVVVTGATWNPCGHMLLNTGGSGGWYFHVAERKGNPRFMRADGYRRYLQEHQKRELRRTFVSVPNPVA